MVKRALLLITLLLSGCGQKTIVPLISTIFVDPIETPLVAIQPVEDLIHSGLSARVTRAFTESLINRLQQKKRISFTQNANDSSSLFSVAIQLVQHHEMGMDPIELTMSIHLKILDNRTGTPTVLLQEVLQHTTLLKEPLSKGEILSWKEESFRISSLGLAYAKLSREIALRIEDYILLATKG
ncbi:MAG: hypothetical protein KR126chlam1_01403 [Chlamydiae bacterium]|nr:hypothetical protein [Chlamydiota bacterium]